MGILACLAGEIWLVNLTYEVFNVALLFLMGFCSSILLLRLCYNIEVNSIVHVGFEAK